MNPGTSGPRAEAGHQALSGLRPKGAGLVLPGLSSGPALPCQAQSKATTHPRPPKLKPLSGTHGAMQQTEKELQGPKANPQGVAENCTDS